MLDEYRTPPKMFVHMARVVVQRHAAEKENDNEFIRDVARGWGVIGLSWDPELESELDAEAFALAKQYCSNIGEPPQHKNDGIDVS